VAEGGTDILLRAVLPEAGETRRGGTPLLQEVKTPTEAGGGNFPQTIGGVIAEVIRGLGAGVGVPGQVQGRLQMIRSFPRSLHLTKRI